MANCKACGAWFSSTAKTEICPACERALKRLNGYAVEVDTAVLVAIQIALEAIRQYRKIVGHDPIFEFSQKEINEIANYAGSMLNGSSEMVGDVNA